MKRVLTVSLLFCVLQIARGAEAEETGPAYIVLGESLQRLKTDFNANQGKVRLLFVVGDTCGICLRGMADLNDAFIASAQHDDRLLTLVVHVPVLGAEERHIPPVIPLLDGLRVQHYWDGVGKSGIQVGEALQTDGTYAWDVWLAFGPGAEWRGDVPPAPEFWMHQLHSLPPELRLDAERFGEKTLALMAQIGQGGSPAQAVGEADLFADGTVIPTVIQPRSVAIRTHVSGAGGYSNLKRIATITQKGTLATDAGTTELVVTQDRVEGLTRSRVNPLVALPERIAHVSARSWEMDGPLVDWKAKGHCMRMGGMLKIGSSLAWKLFLKMANGLRWALYIDSHSGNLLQARHLGDDGAVLFSVRYLDFREVDGFRFPFRVEYADADGTPVAVEEFSEITVTFEAP